MDEPVRGSGGVPVPGGALVPVPDRALQRAASLAERTIGLRAERALDRTRRFVWPVVVVLDASARMAAPLDPSSDVTLAQAAVHVLDGFLWRLVLGCARLDGLRDEVALEVIACGDRVVSALDDGPPRFRAITDLAEHPRRLRTERRSVAGAGHDARRPEWFEPRAAGPARLRTGLFEALRLVGGPPRATGYAAAPWVFLVTGGLAEDGDPSAIASAIVATPAPADDPVRLGVLHLAPGLTAVQPVGHDAPEDDPIATALRGLASTSALAPIGYPDPDAPLFPMYARNVGLADLLFGRWGIRPWDD